MRYTMLLGLLLFGCQTFAQRTVVSSKLTIQVFGAANQILNDPKIVSGGYQAPSFFGNFSKPISAGLGASYRLTSAFGLGLDFSLTSFKSWANDESTRFNGASHSMMVMTPKFQMQTRFRPTGIWNTLTLVAAVGPSFSFNTSQLVKPVFASIPPDDSFTSDSYTALGFSVAGEARYAVSTRFHVGVAWAYSQYWIKSHLYDDESLRLMAITGTVGYRLMINRRFKYTDQ